MRILLTIQTHSYSRQTSALAKAFCQSGHLVIFSIDGSEQLKNEYKEAIGDFDECHFELSGNVTWCGYSQVSSYLNVIRKGLSLKEDWDFVLNISSSCVLTKPISTLDRYLTEKVSIGVDSLIWSFPSKLSLIEPKSTLRDEDVQWCDLDNYAGRNICLSVPVSCKETWEHIKNSPIVKAETRLSYFSVDEHSRRRLMIRPIDSAEHHWRSRYYELYGMRIGRAWLVLSRSLAQRLIDTGVHTPAWGIFSSAFEPDEYLIHNIVVNHFSDMNVEADNLHYGYGITEHLALERYRVLSEETEKLPGKFFLRKIQLPEVEIDRLYNHVWMK